MWNHQFQMTPIAAITIDREHRQRREILTDDLEPSIAAKGLLQPIVINSKLELVAGERRITACKNLGWIEVPTVLVDNLTRVELEILELEENVRRRDLTWQENVRAVARIHNLYLEDDPEWTQRETAGAIAVSEGFLTLVLRVWRNFDDERVQKAGTMREAYNLLARRDQRAAGEQLEDLIATTIEMTQPSVELVTSNVEAKLADAPSPPMAPKPLSALDALFGEAPLGTPPTVPGPLETAVGAAPAAPRAVGGIIVEDFKLWAANYTGRKFNLFHCDFPYGTNLFSSNGVRTGDQRSQMGRDAGAEYDDRAEVFFELLDAFCEHFDKLASLSAHMVFWFTERHGNGDRARKIIARRIPSFRRSPFELIWHKTDNAGIAPDVRREPRHTYESAMLFTRGDRFLV